MFEASERTCRFHPERRAVVFCEKSSYAYCQECLDACRACTDPELYCRHRTSCLVWELCRKEVRARRRAAEDSCGARSAVDAERPRGD